MVLNPAWRARALGLCLLAPCLCSAAAVPGEPARAKSAPSAAYVVGTEPANRFALEAPKLPDLTSFTAEAAKDKIVSAPAGRVRYQRLVEVVELNEFTGSDGRLAEWAARQPSNPRAILVEGGYMTPQKLAKLLPPEHFEETEPGVFILRMPLIITQGATLHIDAKTKDFRMSEDRAAFLVNDGKLFIADSALTAWREKDNGPATFVDGNRFRPFLLAWGGSETYLVKSRFTSLGYANSKSYGVSISQFSPGMVKRMNRPSPKAWVLDSEFSDHWYGFYCYEADDLVIARNVYRDNIVYGIDPHDRSKRLIIAENEAYGTKKSHGIIVSREVNDSWIFRNRSHHNKLSGIVLDRTSVNNVVADNIAYDNQSDGITLYESADNLLWNNQTIGNGRHGIRVRNSLRARLYGNRSLINRSSGIYAHTKDLSDSDRDSVLDPYRQEVSLEVVGGQLTHNRSGPIAVEDARSVRLHDIGLIAPSKASGLHLGGALSNVQSQILDMLVRQRVPVVLERADRLARES